MNKVGIRNELKHHGILGQKWGVRRTPEQLGNKPKYSTEPAIIKAGTNVYRITKLKKENNFSDTFVFTAKEDAIKFGKELKRVNGGKLYMMDMEVTKDILGASEKARVDEFLSKYKNVPAIKEATDLITTLAPQQGITLGVKGENSDLLKYRAYSLAVAKNIGASRTYAKGGNITKMESPWGTFDIAENPKYGMVVDDYMRGNTKLSPDAIEIDSLDTAALIFAQTRQTSLKTKKVSKFKHSKDQGTNGSKELDLWPASGGNTFSNIPLSKFK